MTQITSFPIETEVATPAAIGAATAAQGALADTALQPADIDTLAKVNALVSDATLVDTSDSRLSDARTPTAHKSTHASGGADALTPADIGAATSAQGALADTAVQPADISDFVSSADVTDIALVTQGAYDALDPPVADTLYLIEEE